MNKISTLGYFKMRLKACGYKVIDIFNGYSSVDPRVWTVLINPGEESIYCTYFENDSEIGDNYFEFSDGGISFHYKFKLKTESIEVIVNHLHEKGIRNYNELKV